jgi:hypothetical protein
MQFEASRLTIEIDNADESSELGRKSAHITIYIENHQKRIGADLWVDMIYLQNCSG